MKKKLFFLIFTSIVISLPAQDYGHSLVAGVSISTLNGQAEEIVYNDSLSDTKLSELLWDMDSLIYASVGLRYNWLKSSKNWGVFTDALFKFGIPAKSGVMEDRDWMDGRYSDFLTHYSVHDNKVESTKIIDVNAGFSFRLLKLFLIKPFLSYSYMNFSWSATGGSLLYPSSYGGHRYLYSSAEVITYRQTWNAVGLGTSFYAVFNQYFDIELSLKFSPLIWCQVEDHHVLRDLVITGDLNTGYYFEPSLLFSFIPNKSFKVSLLVAKKNMNNARGDSVYKESGTILTGIPENIEGAGFSFLEVGVFFQYTVLKI